MLDGLDVLGHRLGNSAISCLLSDGNPRPATKVINLWISSVGMDGYHI
jgi:hypothetical protein